MESLNCVVFCFFSHLLGNKEKKNGDFSTKLAPVSTAPRRSHLRLESALVFKGQAPGILQSFVAAGL